MATKRIVAVIAAQTAPALHDTRTVHANPSRIRQGFASAVELLPGLVLCLAVTGASIGLEWAEDRVVGRAWLEALVLAMIIGTIVRTVWTPTGRWHAGIAFSAKTLLGIAVVL